MPPTCTICRHEKRQEIDQALLEGTPFRNIAKRYGTSTTALFRHRKTDIPDSLMKAKEVEEVRDADTLLDRLKSLSSETRGILKEARETKNHAIALNAIGRAEKLMELEARLLGQLNDATKVAVGINVNSSGPMDDLRGLSNEELAQRAQRLADKCWQAAGVDRHS